MRFFWALLLLSACGRSDPLFELQPPGAAAGAGRVPMPVPPPVTPPPTRMPSATLLSVGEGNVVDVEVHESGNTLFLWRRHPDLMVQLFDRSGQPLSPPTLVHTETQAGAVGKAAFLKDGGFVVAYEDAIGSPTSFDLGVRVRRYDTSGAPLRGSDQNVSDGRSRPAVTGLEDGGFAVIAQRFENQVGASPLRVHRFDDAGVPMRISSALGVEGAFPEVWGTRDGGYRVAFSDDERGRGTTLLSFGSDNLPATRPAQLGFDVSDLLNLPDDSLLALSDGQIRRFSANGAPLSEWAEVGMPEGAGGRLAVSGCAVGACVVTVFWSESIRGPLVARMFDLDGRAVVNPVSKDTEAFEVAPEGVDLSPEQREGRVSYSEFHVAGNHDGTLGFGWTARDMIEGRGSQAVLEGLLISP